MYVAIAHASSCNNHEQTFTTHKLCCTVKNLGYILHLPALHKTYLLFLIAYVIDVASNHFYPRAFKGVAGLFSPMSFRGEGVRMGCLGCISGTIWLGS